VLVDTLGLQLVVFCACRLKLLLSSVLFLVRFVRKFHLRLVINKTPNKWRFVENDKCENRDVCM
jgi:hypothetical protein